MAGRAIGRARSQRSMVDLLEVEPSARAPANEPCTLRNTLELGRLARLVRASATALGPAGSCKRYGAWPGWFVQALRRLAWLVGASARAPAPARSRTRCRSPRARGRGR